MKKFLLRSLSFVFVGLLLALFLDYVITKGLRRKQDGHYGVWTEIVSGELNSDLLIMGSSRAWTGYSPKILDSILSCNSYNLGLDGHSFDGQLVRYKAYTYYNKTKPNMLILNIDAVATLDKTNQYCREQYFPYIKEKYLIDLVFEDKDIAFYDRYLPLLRFFGYPTEMIRGIKAYINNDSEVDSILHKGYKGITKSWSPKNKIKRFNSIIDCNVVKLLTDFIDDCKKVGIEIVLVKQPCYYKFYDYVVNLNEINSFFEVLAEENELQIIDYSDCYISYDSTYFYNYTHLNKIGAEKFSLQLAKDLDSINRKRITYR